MFQCARFGQILAFVLFLGGCNRSGNAPFVINPAKLMVSGFFTTYNGQSLPTYLTRLNKDGSLDSGFQITSNTFNGSPILVDVYQRTIVFNASQSGLVRLNYNGTVDSSFNSAVFTGTPNLLKWDYAGRILVASVSKVNGVSVSGFIVRLNPDGSWDQSFSSGSPIGAVLFAVDPSNGVYISDGIGNVYHLLANGSLDPGFTNPAYGGPPNSMVADGAGRLVLGTGGSGGFWRVLLSGAADTSFVGNPQGGNIVSIFPLSNGQFFIGGPSQYNNLQVNYVARVNADSSVDPTFQPRGGSGLNSTVGAIIPSAYGQVYVGGSFISYNSTTTNHIARLNWDGSLDTSFNSGSGFNGNVNNLALIQ